MNTCALLIMAVCVAIASCSDSHEDGYGGYPYSYRSHVAPTRTRGHYSRYYGRRSPVGYSRTYYGRNFGRRYNRHPTQLRTATYYYPNNQGLY